MKARGLMKMVVSGGLMMALVCTDALAGGPPRGGDRYHHDSYRGGGERYHHRGDTWCKVGWFGLGAAVATLTVGAMVDALPARHTTVIVGNDAYYYYDGAYFRPAPQGYVVVPAPVVRQPVVVPPPAPVVVAAPAPVIVTAPAQVVEPVMVEPLEVTVNIPNAKGTFTAVTLKRSGTGFVGPQGEYYPEFPKVEQLRLMYGQ